MWTDLQAKWMSVAWAPKERREKLAKRGGGMGQNVVGTGHDIGGDEKSHQGGEHIHLSA